MSLGFRRYDGPTDQDSRYRKPTPPLQRNGGLIVARRVASTSKWTYWKLWNLSIEGITSFTIAPLRLATYFGLMVGFLSFAYALVIIYKTLAYGESVAGYPSLMTVVLFLGGVQLVAIGIIGEYLGRIFNETKKRPLYFVQDFRPAGTAIALADPQRDPDQADTIDAA